MEAEGHGSCSGGGYFCRCAVPSVAYDAATGSVILECGHDGSSGTVLCHVDLPVDSLLRDGVCRASRSLVVPQPV